MSAADHLSRYACDYCRGKKLRCSREKPKCQNCRSWTSSCDYSRDRSLARRFLEHTRDVEASSLKAKKRSSAEASNPHAHPSERRAVHGISTEEAGSSPRPFSIQTRHPTLSEDTSQSTSIVGTLARAQGVADHVGAYTDRPGVNKEGVGMLSDLCKDFLESGYDFDQIKAAVRKSRREGERFFIPTEPVGRMFVQCFLASITRGYPIISGVPQDQLYDLVFRPSSVQERGWVLIFNTVLATASSLDAAISEFSFQLRWNAWLAADEASIYTEPSILNIQALTVFAAHGQDLVTPGACWSLMSQACQMAQMIKLHLPSKAAPRDSEEYGRNLCLFWSLFNIDKSFSLSFGCPPIMSSRLYKNVDLPSSKHLAAYKPHLSQDESSQSSTISPLVEYFGAFYFVQVTKLAMIEGEISHYYLLGDDNTRLHLDLKDKLDRWISIVSQTRSLHSELGNSSSSAQASIKLGFDFLTYRHHHLVVCLTRSDESCREVCLNSARVAVSLLKDLVAHSEEVFNGIIWQLLYHPFTPFFVLFGEIVTNPKSKACMDDLQCLRQTVLYYLEFQKYHSSAVKLERVAETFTTIAEAFVRHTFRQSKTATVNTVPNTSAVVGRIRLHPKDKRTSRIDPEPRSSRTSGQLESETIQASTFPFQPMMPSDAPINTLPDPMDYQLHLDEGSLLDPNSLFRLFSYSTTDDQGSGMHDTNDWPRNPKESAGYFQVDNGESGDHNEQFAPALGSGKYVSLRDVETNARNQFSNCTFDWFSLENCDM